jgi:hypothetical protein
VPGLRVLASLAFVRSLTVMRSCSARVAMMEITTSRIIPQLSKERFLETAPANAPVVQLLQVA